MRFYLLTVALCALILLHAAGPLAAEEIYWKLPVDGNSSVPANWQPNVVPGVDDAAIFDLGSTGYTVTLGSYGARQLLVGNDKVAFSGFQFLAIDEAEPAIQFGTKAGDVADVSLERGTFYGKQIVLGVHEQATATLTLQGTLDARGFYSDGPGEVVVGAAGKAEVQAEYGRIQSTGTIVVGRDSTAQGTISLRDGGELTSGTELTVGQAGKGELTANDGSRINLNGELTVGRDAGSQGDVSVRGDSAQIASTNNEMKAATIGAAGKGALSVGEGANAMLRGPVILGRDATGEGTLSVDGAGTQFEAYYKAIPPASLTSPGLRVGESGKGTLNVTGGASALLSGPVIVGENADASGSVTIDGVGTNVSPYSAGGAGPLWLTIGKAGKGDVTVSGGARAVFSQHMVLGETSTGDGKLDVTGNDTLFALGTTGYPNEYAIVGAAGKGTMTVSKQAVADLGGATLQIAPGAGSTGAVTITDPHTKLQVAQIDVGGEGTGTLSVLNQGELLIWESYHRPGVINVHSGSIFDIRYGRIGAASDPQVFSEVTVNNAGTLYNGGVIIGDVFNQPGGVISGSGVITGALSQSGGVISPGNSPGTLKAGSLNVEAGTLVIEMNSSLGTAGGPIGWDLIRLQGLATLSGPMTLELVSLSLDNQPGEVFDFDPDRSKSWTLIEGGDFGSKILNPELITIDTSGFANDFAGQFNLRVINTNVMLTYFVDVPEPSTLVLTALGFVTLIVAHRRRCQTGK